VFSPLSLTYALSLMQFGAKGRTFEQFVEFFGRSIEYQEPAAASYVFNQSFISLANMLLVNQKFPVLPQYSTFMNLIAKVSNEDFSDRVALCQKANDFVSQQTKQLINNVISPNDIDDLTAMILLNTIYFKTNWKLPFKEHMTRKDRFGIDKEVDMMAQTGTFPYFADDKVQVLEMLYQDPNYCMGVILPREGVTCNLLDYINSKTHPEHVDLKFPKFTHRHRCNPKDILSKLGLTDAFDACIGDFGGISDVPTYISSIVHEAVVIVDEKGTEAAAATTVVVNCRCIMPDNISFYANRPFTYYIKHSPTNTILFLGSYYGN